MKKINTDGVQSVSKYKKGARLPSVLTAVSVLLGLASLFIVVYMINLLWEGSDTATILWLGLAVCLCQLGKAAFWALALWKAHDFAYSSLLEIRLAMISHLKKLPMSFFQKRKAGDLAGIVEHDVERVELYLAHTMPDVVITILVCASIFIIVTVLDWRLGIALAATVPFIFILIPIFTKVWSKSIAEYQESIKRLSENLMEYIGSISAIKAFSGDETITDKVSTSMRDYIGKAKKSISEQTVGMSFVTLLMEAGIVVVAIVGSIILTGSTEVTSWQVVVFILAIMLSGQFAKNFSKLMRLLYNKIVFDNTMNAIASVMNEPVPVEKQAVSSPEAGDICFRDVTFSYGGENDALKNITERFAHNSTSAIIGPSGSGKSTMANLIMGFWNADSGAVTIGGKSVRDFNEKDLARLISVVQQDTFLFNASIEENIKLGNESASMDEVIDAAKKARVHDVIMGFPEGYQTTVGESGAKLSGGEKQRIAIARMILKNSPIVILDEATAAVDPYNERLIQEAIDNLCEGKTLIIIAHHLHIIANAYKIIVMKDGEIVAAGTHSELLRTNELYKSMLYAEEQAGQWNVKGDEII